VRPRYLLLALVVVFVVLMLGYILFYEESVTYSNEGMKARVSHSG
jgi:hypothetical protein